MAKLPRRFYAQDTLTVARQLLGKRLVHLVDSERLSGRIVETEAYMGPSDVASHARFGPGSRAAPMFGEPGHAYVYFTYGMYYCLNAVTEPAGSGTAVLIRALEPLEGLETMRRNRTVRRPETTVPDTNLASGPGKLCQALALDTAHNGLDLLSDRLWIEEDEDVPEQRVAQTARVGIRAGREHHWRFYVSDSPHVSAHPKY